MSDWKTFVDRMQQDGADSSGIFYMETGATCATSDGFNVSLDEVQTLKKIFNKEDAKLQLGGIPCVITCYTDDFVQGKSREKVNGEKIFFHCEKTKAYFIVASKTGAEERKAVKISQTISDYLKSLNQ